MSLASLLLLPSLWDPLSLPLLLPLPLLLADSSSVSSYSLSSSLLLPPLPASSSAFEKVVDQDESKFSMAETPEVMGRKGNPCNEAR
jgi:hypothetical protein